jgi:glycine dehydrogenase subunit 2
VAQTAVLNANYIAGRLRHRYPMPYFDPDQKLFCAHEFVTVPKDLLAEVSLVDIAKRLIDFGIHPPTMHWPVHDCLMIEPTETESKDTLDRFVDVLLHIAQEIEQRPQTLLSAPSEATVKRVDEVSAARQPQLNYTPA